MGTSARRGWAVLACLEPSVQETRQEGRIDEADRELIPTATRAAPSRYVLRVGEAEIEFGDDAQEETLRLVVEVLRSC